MYNLMALTTLAFVATAIPLQMDAAAAQDIRIDTERGEVILTIPDLQIPVEAHYGHDGPDARVAFTWPDGGWVHGYRVDLLDSTGNPLPQEMVHHVGLVDLERRQIAYPKVLRLFAAGRETEPVMLPGSMGVRMSDGSPIVVYYALVNPAGRPVEGAALRISLAWTPFGDTNITEVFPLILNGNPDLVGSSRFDIPPGVSAMSAEFTLPVGGRARALGGHLHDHAVEIRLEDVLTGKILVRLRAKRDMEGRLEGVDIARFRLTRGGLRLEANRPYRVVSIHENPTSETIPQGAMAYMAGPFIPDDMAAWPEIDPNDPIYLSDLAQLVGEEESDEGVEGHGPHAHPAY